MLLINTIRPPPPLPASLASLARPMLLALPSPLPPELLGPRRRLLPLLPLLVVVVAVLACLAAAAT